MLVTFLSSSSFGGQLLTECMLFLLEDFHANSCLSIYVGISKFKWELLVLLTLYIECSLYALQVNLHKNSTGIV